MAKRLDEILVIDVEATCWQGSAPEGESSEIIEIGAARLEVATGRILEARSLLIRPAHSTVSAFCTELTTITPEMLEADGIPFADACRILTDEMEVRSKVWASYGDYDRGMFERQCAAVGVAYPFGKTHLNVKTLFALMRALPREVGMAGALHQEGLSLIGTHHRGGDDAANIARLLARLLGRDIPENSQ